MTATNDLTFVWGGATSGAPSTNTNSFTVRAPGWARFLSAATGTTDGVTLAAIKGLVEELNDVRAENAEMRGQNSVMQERLRSIDERLSKLPPTP